MTFAREQAGEPAPRDPDFEAAFCIWLRYYVEIEMYDRKLPGALSRHGEWMPFPFPADERGLTPAAKSRRFAVEQRELALRSRGAISPDVFERARRVASEMKFDDQLVLYRRRFGG